MSVFDHAWNEGTTVLPTLLNHNLLTRHQVCVTNFSWDNVTVFRIARKAGEEQRNNNPGGPYSHVIRKMLKEAIQKGLSPDHIASDVIPHQIFYDVLQEYSGSSSSSFARDECDRTGNK